MTKLTTRSEKPPSAAEGNGGHFEKIDYVEIYVGNLVQAMHFYRAALGFVPVSRSGLETGRRTRESAVLSQADIRLVITAPLTADDSVAEHLRLHGDGVKDVALTTKDAVQAFEDSVGRGARPVLEPTVLEDGGGRLIKATVAASGDTVHSFIERDGCVKNFIPSYLPVEDGPAPVACGLVGIDHVAIGVEATQLDRWVDFYVRVMGFHQSHQEDVSTEYSAMNSRVVQSRGGSIKFPMMEPAAGRRKSQIQEYLDFNGGAGAQHLAFISNDIVSTVRSLKANGIQFLQTPDAYYDTLEKRVGAIEEEIDDLRELSILVDRDGCGYLLQIFSKPIQSRPTLFIEVIQRKGALGFGAGNITALFQALERQQAMRGSL